MGTKDQIHHEYQKRPYLGVNSQPTPEHNETEALCSNEAQHDEAALWETGSTLCGSKESKLMSCGLIYDCSVK